MEGLCLSSSPPSVPQALRELRAQLEELRSRGETQLPAVILEDQRFTRLLQHAARQVGTHTHRGKE